MRPAARVAAVAAGGTVLAYLALLAWDQETYTGPDGAQRGPYEAWQVLLLALAVGAAAGWAGWRRHPVAGSLAVAGAVTACWCIDNIPGAEDGLVLVGAVLMAAGSAFGTVVVASIADAVRRTRRP